MRKGLWPLSTARGVALLRAIEMTRPEAARICADPYAPRFVDPFTLLSTRLLQRTGLLRRLGVEGMMNFALARERCIEDLIAREAAAGLEQIVILGAGFDTRAYRLPGLAAIRIFEVDHPLTQAAKHKALRGVVTPPANVTFVAVDFDSDDLGARLRAAGYSSAGRTLFVWQGVIMYLTPAAVDGTLAFVARQSAPGSVLVFDYMYAELLARLSGPSPLNLMTRAMGEDMIFGIDGADIGDFLDSRGFTDVRNVDGIELARLCLTGPNAGRPIEADAAIVSARVR